MLTFKLNQAECMKSFHILHELLQLGYTIATIREDQGGGLTVQVGRSDRVILDDSHVFSIGKLVGRILERELIHF